MTPPDDLRALAEKLDGVFWLLSPTGEPRKAVREAAEALRALAAAQQTPQEPLREFYDAQVAFNEEDEDHDRRRWEEAGARLARAHEAVAHETPAPRPAEAHQETARAIAYEDGPIADSWSDGHSCGSYGCCGGGKEIDRAELQRVIAAALDAAQQAGLSLSIERDPLAVSELLDDSRREREMYHGLVYQIRKLHHEWRDVQLLDLPAAIAAAIATAQQATQPCMRKYVTCDADESPDNWCEACFLRLSPRPVINRLVTHETPAPRPAARVVADESTAKWMRELRAQGATVFIQHSSGGERVEVVLPEDTTP